MSSISTYPNISKKHMLAKIYHPVPMYLSDMMQFPDHYNISMMSLSKHSNEQPSITLWKSGANMKPFHSIDSSQFILHQLCHHKKYHPKLVQQMSFLQLLHQSVVHQYISSSASTIISFNCKSSLSYWSSCSLATIFQGSRSLAYWRGSHVVVGYRHSLTIVLMVQTHSITILGNDQLPYQMYI